MTSKLCVLSVFLSLAIAACGAEQPGFDTGRGDSGTGDGSGGGDGSTMDGNNPLDVVRYDVPDPMVTPDSACARQTTGTQRQPMNLLLVLDRSGSMSEGGPPSKWTSAVAGINRLLDTLTDDTRVGLVYFPARANPDVEASYNMPVVPMAPLSTTRAMIRTSLSGTSPNGNTPMACAIPSAVAYLNRLMGPDTDGTRNIVLITDGAPTLECSGTMCSLFDIACVLNANRAAMTRIQVEVARAATATPQIRTYVLGTPDADNAFLSNVAVNGQTRRAPGCEMTNSCHYSLGSGSFETDLNRALDEIRGRAASCEFRLMIDLTRVDPNLVNVTLTVGGMTRTIPRDVRHMNGWDYSPDMRTVILYGMACDSVRGDMSNGRVEILFGCPTLTPG